MGGNAYMIGRSRGTSNNGDKGGRKNFGPSPLSAVASLGFGTEEENTRTTYEKQLALHCFVLNLCLQLLALMGFQSVFPLVIEAALVFLIAVGTIIAYVVSKDHKALRTGIILSGIIYIILFFFAQGCTPMAVSGGRVWVLILPTLLLHSTMGGALVTEIACCVGHAVFFAVVAGLESGGVKCFDPDMPTAVTSSEALTLVEVILPAMLVIGLVAFDAHRHRVFSNEAAKSEEFAKNVLRSLLKQDYAATTLTVNEYDNNAENSELSYSDEAIISSMQSINKLHAMIPSHIRPGGDRGGDGAHEIKRKNSAPNLNGGLNPPRQSPTPEMTTPNITFVQAFGDHAHDSEEGNSGDEAYTTVAAGGTAGIFSDDDDAPFTKEKGNNSFLNSKNSVKSPTKSPTSADGDLKRELSIPIPSIEKVKKQPRKMSNNSGGTMDRKLSSQDGVTFEDAVAFLDGSENGRIPPQNLRRRQSMASGKFSSTMVLEPSFIVVFTLPRITSYATRGIANLDLLKLVFDEFADNAKKATDLYDGRLLWHSFAQIYAKFPDVFTATCAALAFQQLMRMDAKHYKDHHLLEAKAHLPFIIILHAHVLSGIVGTAPAAMASMGASPADHVVNQIIETVAMQDISPPAVVAPLTLELYLEDEFFYSAEEHSALLLITGAKNTNPDGLPKCVSDPPYININNTEITDFAAVLREMTSKLVEKGQRELMLRRTGPTSGEGGQESATPRSPGGRPIGLFDDSIVMAASGEGNQPPPRGSSFRSQGSQRSSSKGKINHQRLPPEVIDMWNEFDADRNGYLDREEVREVLLEMGIQMTDDEQRNFFDSVDADKSGTVTLDEFHKSFFSATLGGSNVMSHIRRAATAMARNTGDNLPVVLNAWKKYDADGSGSLESDELYQVLKDLGMEQSEEEVHWLVQYMDKNGNGSIEFDEFAALFSEDNVANVRLNIVKERIQTVQRVMANKSSGKIYSNQEQLERDRLTTLDTIVETFFVLPIFMYIVYNSAINLYRTAMGVDLVTTPTHMYIDLAIDYLIFGMWVGLKLLFLPREQHGQIIWKRKDVLLAAMQSTDFWFDIVVLLPLDIIFFSLDKETAASLTIGYFRLNKCLSMLHFDNRYLVLTRGVAPPIQRVGNALVYYLTFAHLFGCALIGVARQVGGENISDMVGTAYLLEPENRDQLFLKSFYWAMLTMAGQLKGEPVPANEYGLYLALCGCLVGLPMFTIILGTVGNAVNVEDSEARFLSKLDDLRGYFSYTKMPIEIENECVGYYRHLFNTTGTLDIADNPLDELPVELTVQVTIEIGKETLKKVPIFTEACTNLEFVHELTSKLVPRVLEPSQVVMKKGDRGTNMYFLTFGECNVVSAPGPAGIIFFTFKAGGFFGEIALLHGGKRTATICVGASRYANVLTLDKQQFEEVAETFPQSFSSIHKSAGDRIRAIKDTEEAEKKAEKEKRRLERQAERKAAGEIGSDEEDAILDMTDPANYKRASSPSIRPGPNMLAMIKAQTQDKATVKPGPAETKEPIPVPGSSVPPTVLVLQPPHEGVEGGMIEADTPLRGPNGSHHTPPSTSSSSNNLLRGTSTSTMRTAPPPRESSFARPITPGLMSGGRVQESAPEEEGVEGSLGGVTPRGEEGGSTGQIPGHSLHSSDDDDDYNTESNASLINK